MLLTEEQIDQMIPNTWAWVEDAKKRRGEDLPEACFELFAYMGASIRLKWKEGIKKYPSCLELVQAMKHVDFIKYRDAIRDLFEQIRQEEPDPEEDKEFLLQILDERDHIECALLAMEVFCKYEAKDFVHKSKAVLWQADAFIRINATEFFIGIEEIREVKEQFPRNLDQDRWWWWFYIPDKYKYDYEEGHWSDWITELLHPKH